MKNIIFLVSFFWVQACTAGKSQDTTSTDTNSTDTPTTTEPTVCTESSGTEGSCECSTEEGFTTYQFTQGQYQRCFTTYVDPQTADEPLPLVIEPDCYSSNALQHPDGVRFFSTMYNVRSIELSSPTGGWDFPLNNEVNADNYSLQCDPESSREIEYLQGVFSIVDQLIADGLVDENKIYVSGFSQNSMFSIFAATCFPERIAGISQGGSGLYSETDGSLALPQCEGACTQNAFAEYGDDCVTEEPCDTCSFFPVYPTSDTGGETFQSCILMYDNDEAAHSTAVPAHKYLTQAGHSADLNIFASHPESGLGGHTMPLLGWEWANSCLGVNPSCSTDCETTVVSCVEDFQTTYAAENNQQSPLYRQEGRELLLSAYRQCLMTNDSCTRGCSATEAMLNSVEPPACVCSPGQTDCDCTTSDVPGPCQNQ